MLLSPKICAKVVQKRDSEHFFFNYLIFFHINCANDFASRTSHKTFRTHTPVFHPQHRCAAQVTMVRCCGDDASLHP